MAIPDDELPVLNEIIRSGNESVIRSSRFEFSNTHSDNQAKNKAPHLIPPHSTDMDSELEYKIDQIVDKHMTALRKELSILINRPL